ncbi:hypothetical protein A1Q2_00256 [Trichosporon asahii var. asahii CBS 8904]|uniref:Uncharacterized protein n=1 Tax=Trichosporon asahii var. asahii (strain CBS 8904) TaxID=1220162 RepID=K1VMR1_TRIAC|nr:hypothetical protein A1Q2_00256 [Trichosporon asahii var. asahii CBS 8904]
MADINEIAKQRDHSMLTWEQQQIQGAGPIVQKLAAMGAGTSWTAQNATRVATHRVGGAMVRRQRCLLTLSPPSHPAPVPTGQTSTGAMAAGLASASCACARCAELLGNAK